MTQPLSVDTTLADEIGAPGFWERVFERWCQNIDRGVLTVRFPSGRRITFRGPNPGPEAAIRLHHPRVIRRLFFGGDIGLAEGYMADEWDCRDLTKVLAFGAANLQAMDRVLAAAWPRRLLNRLYHSRRANTRRGSRRNIAAHYDLGNTFYRHWLDETMTYSAALFAHPDEDLAVAQERKYRRLAEAINLSAADHVLEVGCGWGGFATFAARTYGCRVTGLTLSKEQAAHATAKVTAAGLADQVEIRIQDYRDVAGSFDKIVSIEMFEAVGEENWPIYYSTLRDRLRPGGRIGLQAITIANDAFPSYRAGTDFIQRYIFPGGLLASPRVMEQTAQDCGLATTDDFFFGDSYAETMRRWQQRFLATWPEIEPLGFDRRFQRMWQYYLSYCEAGFRQGHISVGQFVLAHK